MKFRIMTIMVGALTLSSSPLWGADIITSVPEGGKVEVYARSGNAYWVDFVSKKTKEYSELNTEIVSYADGTVYMKNPVSQIATDQYGHISEAANSYIKGTVSGDKMTFVLPQALHEGTTFSGDPFVTECVMLDVKSGPKATKSATQTLSFTRGADGVWSMDCPSDGSVIAGSWGAFGDADAWTGHGDWNVKLVSSSTPEPEAVSFPEGSTPEKWAATYGGNGYFVDVVLQDDAVYVGGLFASMPNAVVKGEREGDNYVFAQSQYLGINTFGDKAYFNAATYELLYDEAKDRNYRAYVPCAEPAVFTYDAASKTLTTGKSDLYFIMSNTPSPSEERYPTATTQVDKVRYQSENISLKPATPELIDYTAYTEKEKEGWIEFNLPAVNTEGELLNADNLYWRVLTDESVYEVKYENGHYYGAEGIMTELPYNYTIDGIRNSGARHTFSFYNDDFTFIGVQALYRTEEEVLYSDILSANGAAIPGVWTGEEPGPVAGVIREVEGGEVKMFNRSGFSYIDKTTRKEIKEYSDVVTETVFMEDGTVYLKNPLSQMPTNSYIKGVAEDDKLTFTFPQIIDEGTMFNGEPYTTVAGIFDVDAIRNPKNPTATLSANQTLVFTRQADGSWHTEGMTDGSVILGAKGSFYSAEEWTGYGDWDVTMTAAQQLPDAVVIPSDVTMEKRAAVYEYTGHFVEFGIAGDDVYIKGLSQTFPESAIKGTKKDDKVVFSSPQYLTLDAGGNLMYLAGASLQKGYDEAKEREYEYFKGEDELVFTLDQDNNVLTTDQYIVVTATPEAAEILSYTDCLPATTISSQPEQVDMTPAAPVVIKYSPLNKKGEGCVEFNVPTLNTERQLIASEDLYYRMYMDSHIVEFKSDGTHYEAFTEPISELPYGKEYMPDIFTSGTRHSLWFYTDEYSFMGLQSVYHPAEGTPLYSAVTTVTGVDPSSLESLYGDKEIVSTEYFDFAGRKISRPEQGIYICVHHYADGSKRSVKVYVR